ncbi:DNA mismatch repair protein MutS [Shouchella shacheensis]|uniref:DNA mismatch repair protein MutS n=1 Tax=Shouchella shacheensis TaxID=1649580 RepID=UPI0007404429|nr:DNA mismatch repair protein MutS [Shouchella shacheensis]
MTQQTPMMKQYLEIKAQYEDAFLFFRLGDFYEMFNDDALKAAQELEITLTGRGQGEDRIPMCGVPHHSAEAYITRLIEKGYKIAICEQVEDPREAKGVVRREVTKLLTPGTLMNGKLLAEKENNYIAALLDGGAGTYGIARCDLSTGEGAVTLIDGDFADAYQELLTTRAKEVIVSDTMTPEQLEKLEADTLFVVSYQERAKLGERYVSLVEGLAQEVLQETYGLLLNYLLKTQKQSLHHLQPVHYYSADSFLKMDPHTRRNLELTETLREKKKQGSLLSVIDESVTAMGGRLLRQWLERPLVDREQIEVRQHVLSSFLHAYFEREALRDSLKNVYDIERLAARIAYGSVNARELVQLKRSLECLPEIKQSLEEVDPSLAERWLDQEHLFQELIDLLEASLVEDPPISVTEGGMIRPGFSEELDTYRDASRNGKQWIAELEQKEREETGIRTLKVGYNRVFGYYIEVTRANTHLLEEGRYQRKQTLTNAERFITPELKEKESLILEADEKMVDLEYALFVDVRKEVETYVEQLQALAASLSEMDVLAGFAAVSERQHYVKPEITDARQVVIQGGRHPVVETVIKRGSYVNNDLNMAEERDMLLITGPNMGGKSTYMRQLALTVVMAQIGCFVPADEATLPIFDQIFTRIGAADDLASGQSTFMVEMLETKYALTKATPHSLIILDEIGRGTSTYDGMALAQAIIEYIDASIGAKTLFSTHYHELTALADLLAGLHNVHVSAAEEEGRVVFLHKVIDGAADRSYGVYVAELAGLPHEVTARAEELLGTLESTNNELAASQEESVPSVREKKTEPDTQLTLFQLDEPEKKEPKRSKSGERVLQKLEDVDVMHTSPFQALELLSAWQKDLRKKR